MSPGCSACPGALAALHQVVKEEQSLLALAVGSPDHERNKLYATDLQISFPFLTPGADVVEQRYRVQSFPLVLVLDETGMVLAKGVVNTSEHVRKLLVDASIPVATASLMKMPS